MTWQDQQHADFETQAYRATQILLIWLGTIAPVSSKEIERNAREALLNLARDMNWPIIEDPQIGPLLEDLK
jgi:hypothetical protein